MRYAVFLRGVNPMNLRMTVLAATLETSGFENIATLLSSGNAVFDARRQGNATLEAKIEQALRAHAGTAFAAFVRPLDALPGILDNIPRRLPPGSRAIVVFARGAPADPAALQTRRETWALLASSGRQAYGYHTPGRDSSAFMAHLQRHFGNQFTTRTADTVRKCARA